MTEQIIVTLPEDIAARVREIAATTAQPIEQIVFDHLQSLSLQLPVLPPDEQAELDALHHLSDDALWTIAREQVADEAQAWAGILLNKNSSGTITDAEAAELEQLVQRADRVMLRKAEAAAILKARGFVFSQADFRSTNE